MSVLIITTTLPGREKKLQGEALARAEAKSQKPESRVQRVANWGDKSQRK